MRGEKNMAKKIQVTYKQKKVTVNIPAKHSEDTEWINWKIDTLKNAIACSVITHQWEDEGILPMRFNSEGIKLGYIRDYIPANLLPEYDQKAAAVKQSITSAII